MPETDLCQAGGAGHNVSVHGRLEGAQGFPPWIQLHLWVWNWERWAGKLEWEWELSPLSWALGSALAWHVGVLEVTVTRHW